MYICQFIIILVCIVPDVCAVTIGVAMNCYFHQPINCSFVAVFVCAYAYMLLCLQCVCVCVCARVHGNSLIETG